MAFENHNTRHREPKGPKVKARRVSEPQPVASTQPGCRDWIAQRQAKREARPLVRLARLFHRG